ncbi:MAG: hypothetical protein GEV06_14160 [Luteitalea sp.]|nr:hypothetical protein [Luteitalea sp.]
MRRTTERLVDSLILAAASLVATLGVAAPAHGQAPPLARLIPTALADAARADNFRTPDDHTRHFVTGTDLTPVPAELNAALALQVTTFPVNLAWQGRPSTALDGDAEDPARLPVPRSSFAERATTLGQDSLSFGFVQQSLHYRALDGLDIEDGEIRFFLQHNDCCGPGDAPSSPTDLRPAFERDVLEEALSVDIDRNVFAFLLNYGVADHLDVGIVVPLVKVDVRTRVTSRLWRTASANSPTTHKFDPLELQHRTSYASGDAAGLGDLVLHGKYRFLETAGGGMAASLNVTLPTGEAEELLGSGVTRTEGRVIWSERFGRVGTHVNASYTRSTGELPAAYDAPADAASADVVRPPVDLTVPDEIGAVAGVDIPLVRRVAVSADVVMRHLRGLSRLAAGETTFPSRGPGALPSAAFVAADDLQMTGRGLDVTQLFVAVGARAHLGGLLVLNADVLFPLADQGLVPRGAVVGFSLAY